MLVLHPRRGRSPHIPHAALARRAAQRRPSPPSLPESPPSPPRSLEDQVHIAYAHDDIHLAKILLLRLKGIYVTGNDDPRIAEVKDEDFDFCFVPYGRLLDDEDEKALKDRQRAELERVEEMRRAQRLKDCERIWDQGKKRLRELKALAVRKRELEETRRSEQRSLEESRSRRPSRHAPTRSVVSYKLVTPSTPREQHPFVYDFMPQPATHPVSRPQTLPPPKSKSPFTRPLFDDSRTVPFTEVLSSMQGPLFPPEQRSTTRLSTSRKRRDAELLDSLLVAVECEADERRRKKGKAPERPVPRRRDSGGSNISPCPTCSSSSSESSSSSRRSWLSFSSASSSVSTAATTPSSSPPSTWLSKPPASPLRKPRPKSWFLVSRPSSHTFTTPTPAVARPCKRCTHLTPVSPTEAPLPVLSDITFPITPVNTSPTPAVSSDDATTPATSIILRRFTQFIDLAKGFQQAYMSATMFAVPASADTHATASLRVHISSQSRKSRPLHPAGARVRPADVRIFTSIPTRVSPSDDLRPIPLYPLLSDEEDDLELPRTVLPNPLPFELAFKPHPVPPRSPFRAVHGVAPPGNVILRVRNVENPVFLRVKALENETRGLPAGYGGSVGYGMWMGKGNGAYGFGGGMGKPVAVEGSLGCGREKVLRVAFEGIGKSRLRFETVGEADGGSIVVEGRGRRRKRAMQRVGDGEGDGEEWVRGGRNRGMWW